MFRNQKYVEFQIEALHKNVSKNGLALFGEGPRCVHDKISSNF